MTSEEPYPIKLRLIYMKLENALDRIHARTIKSRYLQVFTALTRTLLALSFIPPSIPKIMGVPFTLLPTSDPVGHYFDALFKTGFYYNFIGWSQLIAVVLLIIPRTAHLGALMFLPIILNIAVLTTSVGFRGTWLITILMAVACVYLVCWDYPRWKSVLFWRATDSALVPKRVLAVLPFGIGLAGFALFALFSNLLGIPAGGNLRPLGIIFLFSLVFGAIAALHLRFMVLSSGDDH